MPSKRNRTVSLAAIVLVLALVAYGYHFVRRQGDQAYVRDAVQVIAQEVRRLLQENPDLSNQQVHDAVVSLEKASVIHLWYDDAGRIADPWGTPLSIEFKRMRPTALVTCRSAGPDRAMGTADDLYYTTEK